MQEPWVGKSPWRGKWQPTPLSCLDNSIDRGAGQATVCRITKSQTRLSDEILGKEVSSAFSYSAILISLSKVLWQSLSFFLFPFFWPHRAACGILVPWLGIESGLSAVKAQNPNHRTTREFPLLYFFESIQELYYVFMIVCCLNPPVNLLLESRVLSCLLQQGEQLGGSGARAQRPSGASPGFEYSWCPARDHFLIVKKPWQFCWS